MRATSERDVVEGKQQSHTIGEKLYLKQYSALNVLNRVKNKDPRVFYHFLKLTFSCYLVVLNLLMGFYDSTDISKVTCVMMKAEQEEER